MVSRIRELARVDTVKRDPELNFHGLRFAKSSHVIEAQQFSREWLPGSRKRNSQGEEDGHFFLRTKHAHPGFL